jgi:hypothetical protein
MQGIEGQMLFPSEHHPLKTIQGLNEITHRRNLCLEDWPNLPPQSHRRFLHPG